MPLSNPFFLLENLIRPISSQSTSLALYEAIRI